MAKPTTAAEAGTATPATPKARQPRGSQELRALSAYLKQRIEILQSMKAISGAPEAFVSAAQIRIEELNEVLARLEK